MEQTTKKILVIDDDNNLRTVLCDKLNLSGFEATGAENGEVGLTLADKLHPDVILLDLLMPKVNGWQFPDELRKNALGRTAKVILLTALESKEFVAKAMEVGAYGYLVKTDWDLDQVVTQVQEAIKGNKLNS